MLFYAAFAVMLLFCVLWLSEVWDYSPLRAGLALAAGPAVVPAVARFGSPLLLARAGTGATAATGATVFATGLGYWVLAVGPTPSYVIDMLPGLLLTGVGVGLALPALVTAGAASVPPAEFATGSAVVAMSRQIGAVAGTAAFAAAVASPTDAALTRGLIPFVVVCLVAAACSVALGQALPVAQR